MVAAERQRRQEMWAALLSAGGPKSVDPGLVRQLGIYGGAQGVWVDKARTAPLTGDPRGATVGILHTGRHYADDLSDDSLLYHYPSTGRGTGRDQAEVDATKATLELELPLFAILPATRSRQARDVRMGWVRGYDDAARVFLVTFGSQPAAAPPPVVVEDTLPFSLDGQDEASKVEVAARPGQPRFKFRVLRRYGPVCVVCDIDVLDILDAAHLKAKREGGSDDPRNGLVFCANHHRAFDRRLFGIRPDDLAIVVRDGGPSAATQRLTRSSISYLARKPHAAALQHCWASWQSI